MGRATRYTYIVALLSACWCAAPAWAASIVGHWTVEKYSQGQLVETINAGENILIDSGIEQWLCRMSGLATTSGNSVYAYSKPWSFINVGSSTADMSRDNDGLVTPLSNSGIPLAIGFPEFLDDEHADGIYDKVRYRAVAGAGQATGAWNELALCHTPTNTLCLNRIQSAIGTKGANDSWAIQLDISID